MFKFLRKKETTELRTMSVANTLWNIVSGSTPSNTLQIGTVYASIRMISDSVSMTPVKVFKKTTKGREEIDNNISKLLKNPAPNITFFKWQNAMLGQLIGWGNGYSIIETVNGKAVGLIYIPSENVSIMETGSAIEPYFYKVTLSNRKQINVFPDDMLHYVNITTDGREGLSPIGLHISTYDRAYYESEYATNYMKNGNVLSGIITTEKGLKPDQIKQLKEDFSSAYSGASNAGKTPVLGDGMNYTQLKPISPADADYIASKKLTKSEIMEIFKVPPPLLGVIDSTYNNTEQLALIYQRFTLAPVYTMIQQELTLKLIGAGKDTYIEFVPDALLFATAKDKSDVITNLVQKGIYTPNEGRAIYNKPDIEGGNEIVLPLNSAPIGLHKEVLTPIPPVEPVKPVASSTDGTEGDDELRALVHKVQSELGRLKKQLGNGKA